MDQPRWTLNTDRAAEAVAKALAEPHHTVDDETLTRLAAALVDRDSYSRGDLTAAARHYAGHGDIGRAADQVAAEYLGPNWRSIAEDD